MCAGYFRGLPAEMDRHHAFVGVGWEGDQPERAVPVIVWASNALDPNGEWAPEPHDDFATHSRKLAADEPFALLAAGVALGGSELARLNAQIGYLTSAGNDPEPVGRVLIEAIREKAADDGTVGSGVMLNCLPRHPGPPGGDIHFISGPPKLDVRTFTYVPADTVIAFEYLGPLVASSDGMRAGSFSARGHGVEGTTGFSYRPSSAPPLPRVAVGQRINVHNLGRNDPCWCGSGKKYKNCHAP